MLSKLKKQASGFTIIEVMIVLAIAGLILLIVFLAVPALQRNSRNTSRRNDIAQVLAAVQEFTNNNNGVLPGLSSTGACTTANTDCANMLSLAKLGIYTVANSSGGANFTIVNAPVTNTNSISTVQVVEGAICGDHTGGSGTSDAVTSTTPRAVVILYAVEGSGNNKIIQCTSS